MHDRFISTLMHHVTLIGTCVICMVANPLNFPPLVRSCIVCVLRLCAYRMKSQSQVLNPSTSYENILIVKTEHLKMLKFIFQCYCRGFLPVTSVTGMEEIDGE
jgi:hypothetical protein